MNSGSEQMKLIHHKVNSIQRKANNQTRKKNRIMEKQKNLSRCRSFIYRRISQCRCSQWIRRNLERNQCQCLTQINRTNTTKKIRRIKHTKIIHLRWHQQWAQTLMMLWTMKASVNHNSMIHHRQQPRKQVQTEFDEEEKNKSLESIIWMQWINLSRIQIKTRNLLRNLTVVLQTIHMAKPQASKQANLTNKRTTIEILSKTKSI